MPNGGTRTSLSVRYGPNAWGPFSPGRPLNPVVQQQVRSFDFRPNVNTALRPREYERFGFPELRAFANVELVRLAIETRKDQIERLDWQIKTTDRKTKGAETRIQALRKFFRKPDGVTPFATFLRLSMEDMLSLDAPAFEKRRSRGGDLIGLEIVPGDTIHPMVDDTGRRPRDPSAIAYQQVIKGVPWADLTNDDLLYVPRNPRPNHLYGFGPVEQIIVTINTILRRQAMQLSHFTESNVPAGLLNAPDGWDATKIAELQTWFDDRIAGNSAEQSKILWGPAGSKYQAFKDSPVKDDFDEWLARIVAFAFSLPPTPFVRQMNKGTANEDQDRALEEGLEPIKLWAKRWIDGIIQDDFGYEDLEFAWQDTPSIDPAEQSLIDDRDLKNGSTTLDEVRDSRGKDPYPDGLGEKPLIYTSSGVVSLEDALAPEPEPQVEPPVAAHAGEQPPEPGQPAAKPDAHEEPVAPGAAGKPAPVKAEKLAKAAPISPLRPKARRAAVRIAKALKPMLAKAGDHVASEVEGALAKLGKAEDDPKVRNVRIIDQIMAGVDLLDLFELPDAFEAEIGDLTSDSGSLALTSIGVSDTKIVDRVFDRAVDYARERAADLVSLDGDESIVASTRNAIRSIIADGLDKNIGGDAIAEAIQESQAFSADRADRIAKTEIAKANGEGKAAGWREAQASGLVLTKEWQVSNDGDTCAVCIGNEADGTIDLEDTFSSGDAFEPAHPDCSCVTVATAHETDDEEDSE